MSALRNFTTGVHGVVLEWARHRVFGGAVVLMGAAGLLGTLITFWPA